ncbi:MAG: chorismate synthase [Candidatus Schekmanbacteria bacterium]|nr:chorismate synthase [Candidatus Schekmanbacteria bacterium]
MRYLTAGESHGEYLTAILEGMPSGVPLSVDKINQDLARRQGGYGRGGRMKIEQDRVKVASGVRNGVSMASPIALLLANRDYSNWREKMAVEPFPKPVDMLTHPRPGHADLTGGIKYATHDMRNILERSSARETAMRVAVGAIAKQLLSEFNIQIISYVTNIGGMSASKLDLPYQELFNLAENSPVRCPDKTAAELMIKRIDWAKTAGDSLGGTFEVVALNVPPGLGSHVHWDRKLNAKLAYALMSIQAIKGVEIGDGFALSDLTGAAAHDEIFYNAERGFYRLSNHAGGIEGGMSNGEPIVLRAVMKPIPTLMRPLRSVDVVTKEPVDASIERSDTCAVPAAAVVAEAVVAFEIASALREKFAGDSLDEMKANFRNYLQTIEHY